MSGTSFDGVDASIIETDGLNYIKNIKSSYVEYTNEEKSVFNGKFTENYHKITEIIDKKHISAIKQLLDNNNLNIDIIGLHGQTLFHQPDDRWTWQYINAGLISKIFKSNVISDFRILDINNGGEGAPLVPIFHKNLILSNNFLLPSAVLNIGGISNISVVINKRDFIGFDTGPGNGPLDTIIKKKLFINYDDKGEIAKKGKVNLEIKKKTLSLIRKKIITKSYDRKILDNICLTFIEDLKIEDALANLIEIIAEQIAYKINKLNINYLVITGGGRKNNYLIEMLKEKLNSKILIAEEVGWEGDAIEAQAFAYLAVRSLLGKKISFKETTGVKKSCIGGVLTYYF